MSTIYDEEIRSRTQRTGTMSAALGMATSLQAVTMFFALRDLLAGDADRGAVEVNGLGSRCGGQQDDGADGVFAFPICRLNLSWQAAKGVRVTLDKRLE
jgi:hypothetical protein